MIEQKHIIVFLTCIILIGVLVAIGASTDFTFKVGGKVIQNPDLRNSTTIKIQNISNVVLFHVNNTVIAIVLGNGTIKQGNVSNPIEQTVAIWRSDQLTVAINTQGKNLPSALTELDIDVGGTRINMTNTMLGSKCSLHANVRIEANANIFPRISLRDTSNTNNVFTTLRFNASAIGNSVTYNSTYISKPSWFTSSVFKVLAVYTEGGDGAADFIFKNITLRCTA